jgi:hypothetical protein
MRTTVEGLATGALRRHSRQGLLEIIVAKGAKLAFASGEERLLLRRR